jgi:hypothetical protein
LDVRRLKEDVRLNAVSEYSFICVDRSFFQEGFSLTDKPKSSQDADKRPTFIPNKKGTGKTVDEEDLGFCFDEDDDDGD